MDPITVNVKNNLHQVLLGFDALAKKGSFATVVALTQTAQAVKAAAQDEMRKAFKHPSRFTLNSLRVRPATKLSMQSEVRVKDDAVKYLSPNIDGGERPYKRMEKALMARGLMLRGTNAVPASDGGTISPGVVMKILSALMAAEMTSGYSANRTARSVKRRGSQLDEYVSLRFSRGRLKPGIYKRGAGHSLHAVFFYVSKAKYRMIFDFYGLSRRVADEAFPRLHRAAMAKWTDR